MSDEAEVEFFGAHIKVKSARLAELLNGGVGEDVVVVGARARELVSPDERDDEMNVALGGIEAGRQGAAPAVPGVEATAPDASGTDSPGTDSPGTDSPGTDSPGTDSPGTDTTGTDATDR